MIIKNHQIGLMILDQSGEIALFITVILWMAFTVLVNIFTNAYRTK